ncbi:MAG: hypothetical protein N2444_10090, partial [Methylocystis sp.]|nr:hypothetical protein [Methylocystis sp.]
MAEPPTPRANVVRLAPLILLAALLGAGAWALAPEGLHGGKLLLLHENPVALVDHQLDKALTAARFSSELDAALDAGDDDLAQSFIDLGRDRGVAPSETQRARLATLEKEAPARMANDFADGFVSGGVRSGAGMVGALVGDLSGYGDVRDRWREVGRIANGEAADQVVLGAAAAGLALSAAAWGSLGAATPARGGLTLVKSMQKTGKLSAALAGALTAAAAKSFDRETLAASLKAATRLDVEAAHAAALKAMRFDALAVFRTLGEDAASLYRRIGARGTKQVFAVAAEPAEITAAARLAAARGSKTRAIIATLGRGALAVAPVVLAAFEAFGAFIACAVALALTCRALGAALAKIIPWPAPRKSRPQPSKL